MALQPSGAIIPYFSRHFLAFLSRRLAVCLLPVVVHCQSTIINCCVDTLWPAFNPTCRTPSNSPLKLNGDTNNSYRNKYKNIKLIKFSLIFIKDISRM